MSASPEKLPTYADACETPYNTTGHSSSPTTASMDSPALSSTSNIPATNALHPISSTDSVLTQVNVTEHARVFHLFPVLVAEIRLKIWGVAASVQRVIELDNLWIPNDVDRGPRPYYFNDVDGGPRPYIRIAPNSRCPPAILHVCQESRFEASRYYQLTNFEVKKPTAWGPSSEHYIYYNPRADVVYLGEQSGVLTLIAVLRKGLEIPNLAVVHKPNMVHQNWIPLPDLPLLRILHGINQDIVRCERWFQEPLLAGFNHWPGCIGLKTLLLVLPSGEDRSIGGNSMAVHFQTATDVALTEHFAKLVDTEVVTVTSIIRDTVKTGHRQLLPTATEVANLNQGVEMDSIGRNRWEGDDRPHISFATINDGPLLEKVSHTISIDSTVINNKILDHDNHAMIRKIARQTGCSIEASQEPAFVPPERDEQGRLVVSAAALAPTREVTFYGTWEEIRIAEVQFRIDLRKAQALHG